jgi:hypothetical protein
MGHRNRILVILALVLGAGLAVLLLVRGFGPERLAAELEQRLSAALSTPVMVGELIVSSGGFFRVEARDVRAWPGEDGSGLEIRSVSGSIDALSLLIGEVSLRSVRVEEARLRTSAIGDAAPGRTEPPRADSPEQPRALADELPSSLRALEAAVRYLLEAPRLAWIVELGNSRIELEDVGSSGDAPLELRGIQGRLVHRRFSSRSQLALSALLAKGERELGVVELSGRRGRGGTTRIALTLTALELEASARYLRGPRPDARLAGNLSGEIVYETHEPGSGHLEVDVVCLDFESAVPAADASSPEPIDLPRIEAKATLEFTPGRATLQGARIAAEKTVLRMDGTVARPIRGGSLAELAVEFEDVEVSQVRHLIGWLPEIEREEARAVVAGLQSGRLVSLAANGVATLSGWQDFLAGRTRVLPENFQVDAELADTVVRVGDSDRLEDLRGRMRWAGQRAAIHDATAFLNGTPLPELDLVIDGFPNFIAGDAAARELRSGAEPLTGIAALWESLRPEPDAVSADVGTTIELDVDYLDHPMFVWPIRDLQLTIETRSEGIRIEDVNGIWAGVPIRGSAEWAFLDRQQVTVELTAGIPADRTADRGASGDWARGQFAVGPIAGDRWRQSGASGYFEAAAGRIRFHDLAIELEPSGVIDANGSLDLSETDAVPFQASFGLENGDAVMLAELVRLPAARAKGRIDLAGSFEGVLRPGTRLLADLEGLLEVSAMDGAIRKTAPPMVAIARASEDLDELDRSEVLLYQRVETVLEFEDGRMYTQAFSLDGPKVGVVASGTIDLMSADKEIDARVALFLFRKLDRVLEKIPILNRLLLGTDANLVATYFQISGAWEQPDVKPILLPGSAGPASVVLQGVPLFVMRGINALGSIMDHGSTEPAAPVPIESPETPGSGS